MSSYCQRTVFTQPNYKVRLWLFLESSLLICVIFLFLPNIRSSQSLLFKCQKMCISPISGGLLRFFFRNLLRQSFSCQLLAACINRHWTFDEIVLSFCEWNAQKVHWKVIFRRTSPAEVVHYTCLFSSNFSANISVLYLAEVSEVHTGNNT